MKKNFSGIPLELAQKREESAFNWQVDQELTELLVFFERSRAEAFGREVPQPDDNTAASLIKFAQGECSPEERLQVCELLKQNPTWLRWLADRVKLGRNANRADGTGERGM